MFTFIKTHKILAFAFAFVVIGAVAVSSLIFFRPAKPAEVVANSPIGETIEQIVPQDKLVSMMVAPATEDWWKSIDKFTPTFNLDDIDLKNIPGNPVNLGWSVSYSETEKSDIAFGLNTVYLEFKDSASAVQAMEYISGQSAGTFQVFQVENIAVIIPTWAFSDRDFLIEDFNREVGETNKLENGSWVIDFDNWLTMNETYYNESINQVANASLANLGFTGVTGATWQGTSDDGLKWSGEFSEKLWNYDSMNTAQFQADLKATEQFTPFDPELAATDPKDWPEMAQGQEILGVMTPHQSLVLDYLSVATSDNVFGQVRNPDGTYINQSKPESENQVVISTDPNAWVSIMSDRTDAPPMFKFSKIDFVFSKTSNRMNIELTTASWAEEV